ncbi:MAG: response regulator transcription factor [Vicinamibacterales bacterium]
MPSLAQPPILIVEDDRKVSALVALYLGREGFATVCVFDGREAVAAAAEHLPQLVILDLMLPHVDGRQICQEIRRTSSVPILMLTARQEETDRITGFVLGADDYVVKPFSPRELVARVKAILRRTRGAATETRQLTQEALRLDLDKRRVFLNDAPVALTASEYVLLEALMRAPGRLFSRQELLDYLYQNGEAVVERVIDVHLGKLRQKIEEDPARPRYILTARGLGYRFADSRDTPP